MSKKSIELRQSDTFFNVIGSSFKLINQSWEALRINLMTFVQLYLVMLIPAAILFALVVSNFTKDGKLQVDNETISNLSNTSIALGVIAIISLVVLGLYVMLAVSVTQLAGARGQKIGFKDAIEQAHPYIFNLLILAVVTLLAVMGGLLLLIVPGIIVYILLSLAIYFMIDKKLSAMDAIKKCFKTSKKHWKLPAALLIVQLIVQLPSDLGVVGSFIATALSIAYFCLPAIVYLQMAKAES